MITTGPFRKEIRLALLDAFPTPSDLRMLVEETLNEPLQNISLANDMPTVAFDLISWARARGRLTELIAGAAAERPRSNQLQDLSRLAERAGADPLPSGPRGVLALHPHPFRTGQPLFILQHPMARPLRLAIGTVTAPNPSPVQVAYDANTEGGSSGSPCFNAA